MRLRPGQSSDAIQAATASGNVDLVRAPPDARADINADSAYYIEASAGVAGEGNLETVTMLLEAGADARQKSGSHHDTAQELANPNISWKWLSCSISIASRRRERLDSEFE